VVKTKEHLSVISTEKVLVEYFPEMFQKMNWSETPSNATKTTPLFKKLSLLLPLMWPGRLPSPPLRDFLSISS